MNSCLYNNKTIEWFIEYGNGVSPKKWHNFTPQLTNKMFHDFITTKGDIDIHRAVRETQIKTLGGNQALCNAIMKTTMQGFHDVEYEKFYVEFLIWIINQGMFDHSVITDILDYVVTAKFTPSDADLDIKRGSFSLKGRNILSITKDVEKWHRFLNEESKIKYEKSLRWEPIPNMKNEFVLREHIIQVKELTTVNELKAEGKAMHNCVASYAHSCSHGDSHIFSFIVNQKRLCTLEVNSSRTLVQARKYCNAGLENQDRQLVRLWASQNGIQERY